MLGHEDSFAGINAGNYMIFDNLVVTQIEVTNAEQWSLYH
jgi:hypothetical protein